MSVHYMSWVFRHSPTQHSDRLVLLALADNANDDTGLAWPSVETLAAKARVTERTCRRCLRHLERDECISSAGVSKSGTIVYKVLMRGGVKMTPPVNDDPTGGSNGSQARSQMTPEPSVNHQENRHSRKASKEELNAELRQEVMNNGGKIV